MRSCSKCEKHVSSLVVVSMFFNSFLVYILIRLKLLQLNPQQFQLWHIYLSFPYMCIPFRFFAKMWGLQTKNKVNMEVQNKIKLTWRSKKNLVRPNLAAMAKNIHFHLTSSGPKTKMFATPTNLDSMIFRDEKCHIFIIYHKKYVNGSFRGPNGPKTKILSF